MNGQPDRKEKTMTPDEMAREREEILISHVTDAIQAFDGSLSYDQAAEAAEAAYALRSVRSAAIDYEAAAITRREFVAMIGAVL